MKRTYKLEMEIEVESTTDHIADYRKLVDHVHGFVSSIAKITYFGLNEKEDFDMTDVKHIQCLYTQPVTWDMQDVIRSINDQAEDASYTLLDVTHTGVRWNTLHVHMKDGTSWEDEGGYDGEIDWKYPTETVFLSEHYDILGRN